MGGGPPAHSHNRFLPFYGALVDNHKLQRETEKVHPLKRNLHLHILVRSEPAAGGFF